jgi:S-disulfanyl-L-cysteine oxidoreductase SoxD
MFTFEVSMFGMRSTVLAASLAFAACAGTAGAADAPRFGQPISPADAAAWDISIGPDGVGLPSGSGTPAQGAVVFAEKCAACHGDKGQGGPNARLVGGQITGDGPVVKTVGSYWPYATTLFDFVRRAMPWTSTKSLTNDEVYAVSAYVLRMNNIIGDNDVLDAKTLPQVKMPNRDGFIPLYPAKH